MNRIIAKTTLLLILAYSLSLKASAQESISFKTEDGWKLQGAIYLPDQIGDTKLPAIILVPEPGVLDRTIFDTYLAEDLAEAGFAVVNFDVRGTGQSLGRKVFEEFSSEEIDNFQLDIRGAVNFLASQSIIDPHRIGVVGTGLSSKYAVLEAAENHPSIQALVLLSGNIDKQGKEYLSFEHSIPVLSVAHKDDKETFRTMSEVYAISTNRSSDMILAVGHGAVMFSYTEGLEEKVVHWLEHNLMALGTEQEVKFKSSDDWELYGTLRLPDDASAENKVPGVVLVHGAKHDQQTYHFLAQEITKQGMATLRFDWRGKGKSRNSRRPADQDEMYQDVDAAIEFFASHPFINSNNLGAVAATLACVNTLQASLDDPRVKTIVLMTALEPNERVKQLLASSDTPIFAIASTGDYNYMRGSLAETTRQIYKLSNSGDSEFLLYDDAGRGSEMLKKKPELEPMILRWFGDKLMGISPTTLHGH